MLKNVCNFNAFSCYFLPKDPDVSTKARHNKIYGLHEIVTNSVWIILGLPAAEYSGEKERRRTELPKSELLLLDVSMFNALFIREK